VPKFFAYISALRFNNIICDIATIYTKTECQAAKEGLTSEQLEQKIKEAGLINYLTQPTYTKQFYERVFSNNVNNALKEIFEKLNAQAKSTTLSSLTVEIATKALETYAKTLNNILPETDPEERLHALSLVKPFLVEYTISNLGVLIKNESLKQIFSLSKEYQQMANVAQLNPSSKAKNGLLPILCNEILGPLNDNIAVMFDEICCEFFHDHMFDYQPTPTQFQTELETSKMNYKIKRAELMGKHCVYALNSDRNNFCENMVTVIKDPALLKECFEVFLDSVIAANPIEQSLAILEEVILPYAQIHSETPEGQMLEEIYNVYMKKLAPTKNEDPSNEEETHFEGPKF
jgi:hypothetical protein